jgi:acyl carrier protein
MTDSGSNGDIKRLIIETLDLRGRSEADIADDEPLFGGRLGLDSLDALELAVALESRFGVTIPDGEEGRRGFASVASISSDVEASAKLAK